jgi:hypothetical protein
MEIRFKFFAFSLCQLLVLALNLSVCMSIQMYICPPCDLSPTPTINSSTVMGHSELMAVSPGPYRMD